MRPPSYPPTPSYDDLKHRCDEYFALPARGETRGVGGIFFDDLTGPVTEGGDGQEGLDAAQCFALDVARGWMDSWLPIVEKHRCCCTWTCARGTCDSLSPAILLPDTTHTCIHG